MLNYCIKPVFDRSDSTEWNMIYPFWWQDEHYQKALVLMYYEEAKPVKGAASCDEYIEAIKRNLDTNILPYIKAHPETEFTVFYPPYSILYWNDVCNKGELETVMEKYRYMSRRFLEYDNVKLFFFQNIAEKLQCLPVLCQHLEGHAEPVGQCIDFQHQIAVCYGIS